MKLHFLHRQTAPHGAFQPTRTRCRPDRIGHPGFKSLSCYWGTKDTQDQKIAVRVNERTCGSDINGQTKSKTAQISTNKMLQPSVRRLGFSVPRAQNNTFAGTNKYPYSCCVLAYSVRNAALRTSTHPSTMPTLQPRSSGESTEEQGGQY